MSDTLQLTKQLIAQPSITSEDAGCQDILIQRLEKIGFTVKLLATKNIKSFWAARGQGKPIFIFAGHTDVVPPGPLEQWHTPPFTPTIKDGILYGRGAADMKSGLAAMITATESFIKKYPDFKGQIGFIITSDEEAATNHGTAHVVDYLTKNNITADYCIVGEASSHQQLGDAIKIGRRGSMHGHLKIIGRQGHIAYPQNAHNPIHACFKALNQLATTEWDQGNEFFPPTSLQIYNIQSGGEATNVIPGSLIAKFNFRFAPTSSETELQTKVATILDQHQLHYELNWQVASSPYFSGVKQLARHCRQAAEEICHITPEPNTEGGTSDGRYIAPTGCEVVELGPVNQSIHKVNEHIKVADLDQLSQLYYRILELCLPV